MNIPPQVRVGSSSSANAYIDPWKDVSDEARKTVKDVYYRPIIINDVRFKMDNSIFSPSIHSYNSRDFIAHEEFLAHRRRLVANPASSQESVDESAMSTLASFFPESG